MYKVLIVEDQSMPRQLLEMFIKNSKNYELSASITDSVMALPYCMRYNVDLVLMDVVTEMKHSGLKAAEEIKAQFPNIKIIIVTSMPEFSWIERAKAIGIESFWYKEAEQIELLDLMDRTMAGESIYPDTTPLVQMGKVTNHDFTDRELQIMREITTGASNADIGKKLGITEATVKKHMQNIQSKVGVRSRAALAVLITSNGIALDI